MAPVTLVGFPFGYALDSWLLLVLAASTAAFSLQLASIRYWLFGDTGKNGENIPLCCNIPMLEFAAELAPDNSWMAAFFMGISECIPDAAKRKSLEIVQWLNKPA